MADEHMGAQAGGRGGLPCLAHSDMCRTVWYRFMGSSILTKVFNFTI